MEKSRWLTETIVIALALGFSIGYLLGLLILRIYGT